MKCIHRLITGHHFFFDRGWSWPIWVYITIQAGASVSLTWWIWKAMSNLKIQAIDEQIWFVDIYDFVLLEANSISNDIFFFGPPGVLVQRSGPFSREIWVAGLLGWSTGRQNSRYKFIADAYEARVAIGGRSAWPLKISTSWSVEPQTQGIPDELWRFNIFGSGFLGHLVSEELGGLQS